MEHERGGEGKKWGGGEEFGKKEQKGIKRKRSLWCGVFSVQLRRDLSE